MCDFPSIFFNAHLNRVCIIIFVMFPLTNFYKSLSQKHPFYPISPQKTPKKLFLKISAKSLRNPSIPAPPRAFPHPKFLLIPQALHLEKTSGAGALPLYRFSV